MSRTGYDIEGYHIIHTKFRNTTQTDSDSSTMSLEAIGQPSITVIRAGQERLFKIMLCYGKISIHEARVGSNM
jgi:hypothetical protein